MIIGDSKIFGRFRYAIWREIFGPARFEPRAAQHERRAHERAAAAVKPFFLLARSWQPGLVEQRDLPLKFHFAFVAFF